MKRVAINQSNYIPWKGYFDLIHDVDLFVFYDDVQFTIRDWRNRNRFKSPSGADWLTIPVGSDRHRLICDVVPSNGLWQKKHWKTLCQLYGKTPYFGMYRAFFQHVYCEREWCSLSQLNQYLIKYIAQEYLGISTRFLCSSELPKGGKKQERLLNMLVEVGASAYISGPSAKAYIEPRAFQELGMELIWKDYSSYPEYPQFYPPFRHDVSILDLLFHTGADAPYYIWGWREAGSPFKGQI